MSNYVCYVRRKDGEDDRYLPSRDAESGPNAAKPPPLIRKAQIHLEQEVGVRSGNEDLETRPSKEALVPGPLLPRFVINDLCSGGN